MRSLAIPRGALYNRVLSLVLCRMILKRSFRSHIAPVMCGTQHGVLERCSTTLWYTADGYRPDKVTDSRLRTLNVFTIKTNMKHRCTAGPRLSQQPLALLCTSWPVAPRALTARKVP